jgi:hypothetical protein
LAAYLLPGFVEHAGRPCCHVFCCISCFGGVPNPWSTWCWSWSEAAARPQTSWEEHWFWDFWWFFFV